MHKCPSCDVAMVEHNPFDPDTLRQGLFKSWRPVYACPLCGEVQSSAVVFAWPAVPAGVLSDLAATRDRSGIAS